MSKKGIIIDLIITLSIITLR